MYFSTLLLENVAKVGPEDGEGKEIRPKINFDKVMPFACIDGRCRGYTPRCNPAGCMTRLELGDSQVTRPELDDSRVTRPSLATH